MLTNTVNTLIGIFSIFSQRKLTQQTSYNEAIKLEIFFPWIHSWLNFIANCYPYPDSQEIKLFHFIIEFRAGQKWII